ncbi:MAG: DUF3592 domain-containing protein [Pirellulales bacterium]
MARRFTFYRKKRGDRVSGSAKLGTFGETLLFAACLLVGSITSAVLLYWVAVPQWRVNQKYVEAQGEVASVPGVEERETSKGTSVYRPRIPFTFVVDGVTYRSNHYDLLTEYSDRDEARDVAARFAKGESYPCWYDPKNPENAVLVRDSTLTFWLLMLLPIGFLAIGLGGMAYNVWHWSASKERRSAIAKLAADIDPLSDLHSQFPSVPRDADVTESPGTTLAYRLPIATLPGWRMFALFGTCLFWNILAALLMFLAARRHLDGDPDWIMTAMSAAFIIPGLWLVYTLAGQLLQSSGLGMTRVEISAHPLEPGGHYEMYVSQGGRLAVKNFEVLLVCEEQATFRQGTDTVTDKRAVSVHPVMSKSDFRIEPPDIFETRCSFDVPATAMHSFRSENNGINWKVVIRGDVERWESYERDFPLVVIPRLNDPPAVPEEDLAAQPA